MCSIPGLGRSHIPRSSQANEPQLLRLCSRARESQLLKPRALQPCSSTRSHCNEKSAHRNWRKPTQQWRPSTAKIEKINKIILKMFSILYFVILCNSSFCIHFWITRKWKSLSCVQLFATPWTTVHGILQTRILEWVDCPNPGIEPRSPV